MTRLPINLENFLTVNLLQGNIFLESSVIFVFFTSVGYKIILVKDMKNPKHTMVCFRKIIYFSGYIINPRP